MTDHAWVARQIAAMRVKLRANSDREREMLERSREQLTESRELLKVDVPNVWHPEQPESADFLTRPQEVPVQKDPHRWHEERSVPQYRSIFLNLRRNRFHCRNLAMARPVAERHLVLPPIPGAVYERRAGASGKVACSDC
jgi:hypothetical protein